MREWPASRILAIALVVLATAPLLVATLAITRFSEQAAYDQALESQRLTAINAVGDVQAIVDDFQASLASVVSVQSFVDLSPSDQGAEMSNMRATDVSYFETFNADGSGRARSDAGALESLPATVSARAEALGVAAYLDNTPGQAFLGIVVPMSGSGFLGAFLPTTSIVPNLARGNGLDSDSIWVFDSAGEALADPGVAPPIAAKDANSSVPTTQFVFVRGQLQVVSTAPIPAEGWLVETRYRTTGLLTSIRTSRLVTLVILLITGALAAISGARLARTIAHPLQALDHAERSLAAGDASAHLPTSRIREIGSLSRTFGEMRSILAQRTIDQENALERAQEALAIREEFLSVAAHELKTPLTALHGHAQLAVRRIGHAGQQRSLEQIDAQIRRLTALVDTLLDVSRLERGQFKIEKQKVDLRTVVQEAIGAGWPVLDPTRVRYDLEPVTMTVDPMRISQLVTNLVSNAVKFSPETAPIDIRLVVGTDVELSVRDYGSGVPVERRGELFQRFFQAHASSHQSGMGLGLYISRQIVEIHGGTIHAEFPADGGSRFVVRLPR